MSKDKVFFKFELDIVDLFQLSAILAAVSSLNITVLILVILETQLELH